MERIPKFRLPRGAKRLETDDLGAVWIYHPRYKKHSSAQQRLQQDRNVAAAIMRSARKKGLNLVPAEGGGSLGQTYIIYRDRNSLIAKEHTEYRRTSKSRVLGVLTDEPIHV